MATQSNLPPYVFTRAQKRALVRSLELYYQHQVFMWQKSVKPGQLADPPRKQKTLFRSIDRLFRTRIKSTEILLHTLGSTIFENVKECPSIRQTFRTHAGVNGNVND